MRLRHLHEGAQKLCDQRKDVVFLIAGQDRVCYGGDDAFTGGKTFRSGCCRRTTMTCRGSTSWVCCRRRSWRAILAKRPPHLPDGAVVLSWSVMDALACGAVLLASDTAPVREMIAHSTNGLLVPFFDMDGFVETANRVLDNPAEYRPLGTAGVR
jgi:hypothetical protein